MKGRSRYICDCRMSCWSIWRVNEGKRCRSGKGADRRSRVERVLYPHLRAGELLYAIGWHEYVQCSIS